MKENESFTTFEQAFQIQVNVSSIPGKEEVLEAEEEEDEEVIIIIKINYHH